LSCRERRQLRYEDEAADAAAPLLRRHDDDAPPLRRAYAAIADDASRYADAAEMLQAAADMPLPLSPRC